MSLHHLFDSNSHLKNQSAGRVFTTTTVTLYRLMSSSKEVESRCGVDPYLV